MKRIGALTLLFLITGALAVRANPAGPALPDATVFRLDPLHSDLSFEVRKMGFFSEKGRFASVDAVIETGTGGLDEVRMQSVIDVTSITLSNDEMRNRLLGEEWFNARDYPEASFTCAQVVLTGPMTGIAEGELTIRGVTRPATFTIRFENDVFAALAEGETFGFTAEGHFSRSDFGMTSLSGIVGDTVDLDFTGRFDRQQTAEVPATESRG